MVVARVSSTNSSSSDPLPKSPSKPRRRSPESAAAMIPGGEPSLRSPLEKPLGELTEEDIAQLTREDCRRFLKDKGMRRPSWNKSQAIQQVISLKALLEARPDDAGPHRKPPPPAELRVDLEATTAKEKEAAPYRRRDPPTEAVVAGDELGGFQERRSPEWGVEAEEPVGQMTIFYDGKVNVFDGVPAQKARAIMQLAASPALDDPPARPLPCRFTQPLPGPGPAVASDLDRRSEKLFGENVQQWRTSREIEPVTAEGPTSRKASLQRYLEKRKDRFKGKRFIGGSSSNLEIVYLNQKFRSQNPEQLIHSSVGSPTHPRPPPTPTRYSSIENKEPKIRISIDLNEEGGGD